MGEQDPSVPPRGEVTEDTGPRVRVCRHAYNVEKFKEQFEKPPPSPLPLATRLKQGAVKALTCDKKRFRKGLASFFPCIGIMRKYDLKNDLINDIISGLTVGVMQLPQGMAYAMLADMPPVVGLYVSFFPVLIYFLLGTSRQVSIGTVAVVSLMTGVVVSRESEAWRQSRILDAANALTATGGPSTLSGTTTAMTSTTTDLLLSDNSTLAAALSAGGGKGLVDDQELIAFKIKIATSTAFVCGLAQIGMGLCRVGFVTTYMGDSLVSGFTTGAAVHVGTSQIKTILGLKIPRFENTFSVINTYAAIFPILDKTNIAELVISIICFVILWIVKNYLQPLMKKKCRIPIPIELAVVIFGTLASYYGGFRQKWKIRTVGKIPAGLPEPSLPTFVNVSNYGFDAVIIGVVAFAQSISLAVLLAKKYHYDIDANKELFGYGAGTLFGSFFSCYPIAASVSRSSVQDSAGGRTQLASVFSAGLVLIVILFIGPLFEELPNACLSAIILVALKSMFMQILELKEHWKVSKYDFAIWTVTFLAVVILSVDLGLYIGIIFAFFTVVVRSQTASVKTVENLADIDIYKLKDLYEKTEGKPGIKVVTYPTPLYYANGELFMQRIYKATGAVPEQIRKALKRIQKKAPVENMADMVVPGLSGNVEVDIVIQMDQMPPAVTAHEEDSYRTISDTPNGDPRKEANNNPNVSSHVNGRSSSSSAAGDAGAHGESFGHSCQNGDLAAHVAVVNPLTDTKDRKLALSQTTMAKERESLERGEEKGDDDDPRPFRHLIIDCTAMAFIDPQGIKAAKLLIDEYKGVNITVYLGGIRDEVWKTMKEAGFTKKYGTYCYLTVYDAVETAKEAVLNEASEKHKL